MGQQSFPTQGEKISKADATDNTRLKNTGTLSADGTEQTVLTENSDIAALLWYIDLSNMQAGDTVVLREKIDVNGDGTYKIYTETEYVDSQSVPVISQTENLLSAPSVPTRVTLEQTAGTNRSYAWAHGVQL